MDENSELLQQLFTTNPIRGRFCHLYHVTVSDAQFIYDMRKSRGEHLKEIGKAVAEQEEYLQRYLGRFARYEEIYYKMYDVKAAKFVGVTRLTQLKDAEAFNFESGVMKEDSNPNVYVDAMFMCYRIGFDYLGHKLSGPWTVHKSNIRMIQLHKLVGIGMVTGEDGDYCILYAKKGNYSKRIKKFQKLGFGELRGLAS